MSGSLFTTGAMASEGCGMNSRQDMQSSGENSDLCIGSCNLEGTQCHCHAQRSQPVEMPNVVLVSSGGIHSDFYGLTVASVKTFNGMLYPEGGPNFPFSKKVIVSPRLFLLNRSLII